MLGLFTKQAPHWHQDKLRFPLRGNQRCPHWHEQHWFSFSIKDETATYKLHVLKRKWIGRTVAQQGSLDCTMGIQGCCMAVALLQTKSRIVSLAAQLDMNLVKENLWCHFVMLEGCKGVMNISSLPGLRCCLAGGTGEGEEVSCGQNYSSHCSFLETS